MMAILERIPCTSDAGCGFGCCVFNIGKCTGPVIAQERDGGCEFGDVTPNDTAAQLLRGGAATTFTSHVVLGASASSSTQTVAAANISPDVVYKHLIDSSRFITGACTSDDASYAFECYVIALPRDGGCDFGDATPNGNMAKAFGIATAFGAASCGFNWGLCAGPAIAQERDDGCGFGDAQSNDTATVALSG
ncbi:hypothetical protein BJ878DRAFT_537394 [Calycina marina]|uniref:Uncharacterized protein n=1 Tax=Calycina marina TaxID=1763456 RepID=A0A9P7YUI6_9HELO|nr:hypothetical protein BJ878DRAFT_537394 [Calycina marina]